MITLQQYLPFTVLKLCTDASPCGLYLRMLQQYLPFTVLKLVIHETCDLFKFFVATVLTVYGIETVLQTHCDNLRLVATVLTVYGIETSLYVNNNP